MYVTNCRKCLGLHLPSHCKGHVRRLRMARTDFRYEKRPEPENVQAKVNIRQQKLTLKPPLRPVLPSLERRFSVSPLTAWLGMPSFSTWGHQTQWCGVTAVTYDINHLNQGNTRKTTAIGVPALGALGSSWNVACMRAGVKWVQS